MEKIGFIGIGNMGYAMLKGATKKIPKENFVFTDINTEKASIVENELGVKYVPDNLSCVKEAKYIVMAVKPQYYQNDISKILPLPQADGIEFLFGCETEMDKFFTVGMPRERFDDFDFVIIPTSHLHMTGFTLSNEDAESNERRAELLLERMDKLFDMDLPFKKIGLAHPVCPLLNKKSREDYLATLDLIPSDELERVFTKAAKLGCGIELNRADMGFRDNEVDRVLRMFRIAKGCGCKFYVGSDAHHPAGLEASIPVFERAVDLLGLTEDDKFHIGG